MLRRKNLIFSFDGTLDSDIKDNIEEICAFGALLGINIIWCEKYGFGENMEPKTIAQVIVFPQNFIMKLHLQWDVAFKREFDGRHLTPFIHILYLPEYDAFHTT